MNKNKIDSAIITVNVLRTYALSFIVSAVTCFMFFPSDAEDIGFAVLLFFFWVVLDPINTLFILFTYLLNINRALLSNFKITAVEVVLFHGLLLIEEITHLSYYLIWLSPVVSIIAVSLMLSLKRRIIRRKIFQDKNKKKNI